MAVELTQPHLERMTLPKPTLLACMGARFTKLISHTTLYLTQDDGRGANAATPGTYDTPKAYTPSMYGSTPNEPHHHAPTPSWHNEEGQQGGMMAAGVFRRVCV